MQTDYVLQATLNVDGKLIDVEQPIDGLTQYVLDEIKDRSLDLSYSEVLRNPYEATILASDARQAGKLAEMDNHHLAFAYYNLENALRLLALEQINNKLLSVK